jgi:hypothetical protein
MNLFKKNCYWTTLWVNPSLGGTTRNHPKEFFKDQKEPNHFFGVIFVKCFHYYNFFFHVYQLHVLIYGLNFIGEFNKLENF